MIKQAELLFPKDLIAERVEFKMNRLKTRLNAKKRSIMLKLNSKDRDIWFVADTHYSHKNICKATTTWNDKSGCRNFKSLESMNNTMINNINSQAKSGDVILFLGD